nr:hypothetical protein KXZ65_14835 [Pectobacterium sp. PL152]
MTGSNEAVGNPLADIQQPTAFGQRVGPRTVNSATAVSCPDSIPRR